MAFNLGDVIVNLKADSRQLESGVSRAESKVNSFAQRVNATNFQDFAKKASNSFNNIASGIASVVKKLAIVAVGASYGGSKFVNLASDLETAQLRMSALSGSTDQARKVLGQLYTYSLGKPLAFPDVAKSAQTLMGYGVEANKVVDSMKALSKFAIVNGADMGQLALAYGQVNAKGKLMGQEIIQLTNNFVPVSQVIAKHFNVSVKEAQSLMEGGKVSAKEFNEAMANFIPENELNKQSKSFRNRMISLQGQIRAFGLELLGVKVDPELGLVVKPGGLFDKLSNYIPKLINSLKKLRPTVVSAFQWIVDNASTVKALIISIGSAFVFAKAGAIAFAIASSINPIGAIVTAVTALVAGLTYLQVKYDVLGKTLDYIRPGFMLFWNILKQIGSVIYSFLAPAIGQMINSVKEAWKAFEPLWQQIKGPVMTAMKIWLALMIGPVVAGILILVGAITGIIYVGAKVISAIARVMSYFYRFASSAISAGRTIGNAFSSMYSAVKNKAGSMVSWVGSIPGKIVRALGNLSNLLVDAGKSIINGLWNGMKNKWNEAKDWVGSVGSKIKNLKGPIEKDRVLLLNEGKAIMKGLNEGLISGFTDVRRTLINSTGQIKPLTMGGAISGGSSITNNKRVNINGPINIGSQQDADYLMKRIDKSIQLASKGMR